MKTMSLLTLFGILVAMPAGAEPFCRTRPTYTHAVTAAHTHPVYDGENRLVRHRDRNRVQVDIVEVAQINPAYSSAYSPDGYDSATQADLLSELRRLRAQVDALSKSQLDATARAATAAAVAAAIAAKGRPSGPIVVPPIVLPSPEAPVAVPSTPGPTEVGKPKVTDGAATLAIITAHCAACHQAGNLAPDQRFTLIDARGNLVSLTDKQKLRVITKTYSGQMPPPNNAKGMTPLTDSEVAAIVDLLSGGGQ